MGLVLVGVASELPLLPQLGTLAALTVLGVLALEGLLVGAGPAGSGASRDGPGSAAERPRRRVGGPVAALLLAGGTAGAGMAFDIQPLVLFGALLVLAVAGGLATVAVLASERPGGRGNAHG